MAKLEVMGTRRGYLRESKNPFDARLKYERKGNRVGSCQQPGMFRCELSEEGDVRPPRHTES